MINDSWQSLGLDLLNINVLANFHLKKDIQFMRWGQLDFFSPEFGPRQSLDRWQFPFGYYFGLDIVSINVYATFYQTTSMFQKLGPVSFFLLFGILTEI